jgi:hypothetical protein
MIIISVENNAFKTYWNTPVETFKLAKMRYWNTPKFGCLLGCSTV